MNEFLSLGLMLITLTNSYIFFHFYSTTLQTPLRVRWKW